MKPRYRYNNKTKKWDEVFRFNTNIHVIGSYRPDGTRNSFIVPHESPLVALFGRGSE